MQKYPLVSVIIPCYNGEAFIDRSIESVYLQDYPRLELIVVDDGSTDASKEHIMAWEARFEEKGWVFTYQYQNNRGPGGAIATGLTCVTGEYLTLLDADDRFLPNSIQKRAEFLTAHDDFNVVRTNGWRVSHDSRSLFADDNELEKKESIFDLLVYGTVNNWAGSYMVRMSVIRDYYKTHEFYPSRYGQNLQLLMPATYAGKCGFIDEPLMEYILRENSLSQADGMSNVELSARACRNLQGYHDIRLHLIEELITDSVKREEYKVLLERLLLSRMMGTAEQYEDKEALIEYYQKLKASHGNKLDHDIMYYRVTNPPLALVLRCWRKFMVSVVNRGAKNAL